MTYAVRGKCMKQSGKSVRSVIRPPDAEDMHLAHKGVARRQSATTERDTMRDARMRSRYTGSVIEEECGAVPLPQPCGARVGRLVCITIFSSAREAGSAPEFPQVIEW